MFCPKCGTQNPDNGKFCRSCGTDLTPVTEALSGKLKKQTHGFGMTELVEPAQFFDEKSKHLTLENALVKLFMGMAFLIVSIVLAFTQMGRDWWFWLLIPAFGMMGSGLAQYIQIKNRERQNNSIPAAETNKAFSAALETTALPPTQNDYISPVAETRYKTSDLAPPSVVEDTTRQLEVNQEGETMTLPKTKQ